MNYLFKVSLLISFLFACGSVYSQSAKFEHAAIKDTAELYSSMQRIRTQLDSSKSVNIEEVNAILKASLSLQDTITFFNLSNRLSRNYFAVNDLYQEGILFLQECQRMLNDDNCAIDEFDNALGIFYRRLNFHSEALDHYYKSLSWFEKYDPDNATIPLGNLADIYFENKNFEKALKYNELALTYSLKLEDEKERLSNTTFDYFRIAAIYHQQGKDAKAESYFEKSLKAGREYDSDGLLLLLAISKKLEFYNAIGSIEQCENLIQEGDRIFNENIEHQYQASFSYLFQKNKYYLLMGDLDKARLPEEMKKLSPSFERESYQYGINYYTQKNDIGKIIEYNNKLIELNNAKTTATRQIAYSNIEEKYTNRKLAEENEVLTKDIESGKRTTLIAFSILLLITSLLVSQLINNRRYKKLNNQLQINKEDLEKSNEELVRTNEELERFSYIASHDLKTPLFSIINFTDLLENELKLTKDNKAYKYLSFIKDGGIRLNNLVSDTLEYSSFSDKKFRLKKEIIDLNKLLEDVENSMSDLIHKSNATIESASDLPRIESHYSSLVLLFQKIIENGITYNTSDNPTIKIEVKENPEFCSISIQDNGIGVAKMDHEKIFTMFSRLHNHHDFSGSGLGLSTSRKIVKRLDGEIFLQSAVGEGSTFTIKLPASLSGLQVSSTSISKVSIIEEGTFELT